MAYTAPLRADGSQHAPSSIPSDFKGHGHDIGRRSSSPVRQFTFSKEYWKSLALPSISLPIHHPKTVRATPRYGLSPFGPHISKGPNIWTCDGIDPFAFSGDNWSCHGNANDCDCTDFSCQHSRTLFACQVSRSANRYGFRSIGKEQLLNDGDDGWSDLETTLNSILNLGQLQIEFPDDVVLDSSGRREITRDSLVHEMMRFSRVLRLETFMEIFKVNSFDRLVEFMHCLMTFGSIQTDPVFGYMVIPKGHLYVPARKMAISPRKPMHPLGFSSSRIPTESDALPSTFRNQPSTPKRLPRSLVNKPSSSMRHIPRRSVSVNTTEWRCDHKGRKLDLSRQCHNVVTPPPRNSKFGQAQFVNVQLRKSDFAKASGLLDSKISRTQTPIS
jgi:hypothetical protein